MAYLNPLTEGCTCCAHCPLFDAAVNWVNVSLGLTLPAHALRLA
jgi:hypothetical protein